jgi:WS/DGAT/MGAT family acyltransferase
MARLNPLDTVFLEAEDADPHTSMEIASIAVFEGPQPTYEEFVEAIAGRLPLVPKYRRRVRRVPFDLGPPVWTDDPRFDVRWHVRRATVSPPGDDEQLRLLMGRVMAQRMDRERPPWEYWIVTGLSGDRWGLISKLHHSMVDGVSATELNRVLFDDTSPSRPPEPDTWQPCPEPGPLRLARDAVLTFAGRPLEGARVAASALRRPGAAARDLSEFARGLAAYAAAMVPAPPSSRSGPIGQRRRFTWTRASRQDVATIRKAFDGTLNDVVLAAITHGFRQVLIARGEAPRPNLLRSLVPVSVRAPGEERISENRVSSMLPFLPIHLADPVEQLAAISERLATLKASSEAEAGQVPASLAEYDSFPAFAAPARLIFAHPRRIVTTVTTNVPGPRTPLFALGRRCVDIIPYVPIADPVRIGVSILTYDDAITFGITGDHDTTPDLDVLAGGIEAAMATLTAAADRQVSSRRSASSATSEGPATASRRSR